MTAVRAALPDDAEGIAKAHTRSWQSAYKGVVPEHFLDGLQWELREAFWRKELTAPTLPGSAVLVAEEGDEVVGFVAVGPARDEDVPRSFELYALYVVPEAWATRTGEALLQAALAVVPEKTDLAVWVLEGNPRGRGFYEHEGFVPDGASKVVEIGGQPLVELRYVRAGAATLPGAAAGPGPS